MDGIVLTSLPFTAYPLQTDEEYKNDENERNASHYSCLVHLVIVTTMKSLALTIVILAYITVTSSKPRVKRAPYELVMDAELITGPYRATFSCEGLKYGYYADMDNDCKIFHICYPRTLADGSPLMEHYSFICGNQTVFNQFSATCSHPDEAVPCEMSKDFYYLNERFGVEDEQFHRDEDVNQYNSVISQYGARKTKNP